MKIIIGSHLTIAAKLSSDWGPPLASGFNEIYLFMVVLPPTQTPCHSRLLHDLCRWLKLLTHAVPSELTPSGANAEPAITRLMDRRIWADSDPSRIFMLPL